MRSPFDGKWARVVYDTHHRKVWETADADKAYELITHPEVIRAPVPPREAGKDYELVLKQAGVENYLILRKETK